MSRLIGFIIALPVVIAFALYAGLTKWIDSNQSRCGHCDSPLDMVRTDKRTYFMCTRCGYTQ